jgi:hypothetical protein
LEGAEEGVESVIAFWIADFGFWISEETRDRERKNI